MLFTCITESNNLVNHQTFIYIPRADSVILLKDNSLEFYLGVVCSAPKRNRQNAVASDNRLVKKGILALISENELTTSSEESLESMERSHVVSLIYKPPKLLFWTNWFVYRF